MSEDTVEEFPIMVQTINPLADTMTTDHKALVVRLELDWVEYAFLEELVGHGIAALQARHKALSDTKAADFVPVLMDEELAMITSVLYSKAFQARGLAKKISYKSR